MAKTNLSAERLRELLHYDPDTGVFTWRVKRVGVNQNLVAGFMSDRGYTWICVEQKTYRAHRLAWLYMTGEWPEKGVDHIDGVRTNNAFSNLRLANNSENLQNQHRAKGKNPLLGAHFDKSKQRWVSYIKHSGKQHFLGRFDTAEEAHAAYIAAKRKHHPFCTI